VRLQSFLHDGLSLDNIARMTFSEPSLGAGIPMISSDTSGLASTSKEAFVEIESMDFALSSTGYTDNTIPDQVENLCDQCKQIGLDNVPSEQVNLEPRLTPGVRKFLPLKHILNLESRCPLCRLLRQVCNKRLLSSKIDYYILHVQEGVGCLLPKPAMDMEHQVASCTELAILLAQHPAGGLIVPGRRLEQQSFNSDLVRDWISICDGEHTKCKSDISSNPTGLKGIDCETGQIVMMRPTEVYTTLSYVWGSYSDHPSLRNSSLPDKVPRVVEDAIIVVKKLGFRYLWIDRYCIPQNEPERSRQILDMGKIYANSALTIIDAAGDHPEFGLPGVSTTSRDEQLAIRLGQSLWVGVERLNAFSAIFNSKWETRAWTYQEGLLSRRRLVFTRHQVYFQCVEMHCSECLSMPNFAPAGHFEAGYFPIEPSKFVDQNIFTTTVDRFAQRDLSYDGDALDAIRGVLETFRNLHPPVSHLYGLPLMHLESSIEPLVHALIWETDSLYKRRREFPSWTWAGWKKNGRDGVRPFTFPPSIGELLPESTPKDIEIKFDDCQWHRWEAERELILDRSSLGNCLQYLRIKGWVFDVRLQKKYGEWHCLDLEKGLGYFSQRALQSLTNIDAPGLTKADIEYQLSCLILKINDGRHYGQYDAGNGRKLTLGHEVTFLMLDRMEDQITYERITCLHTQYIGEFVIKADETASIGEIKLRWQELQLR
jgi:hypothetical protein